MSLSYCRKGLLAGFAFAAAAVALVPSHSMAQRVGTVVVTPGTTTTLPGTAINQNTVVAFSCAGTNNDFIRHMRRNPDNDHQIIATCGNAKVVLTCPNPNDYVNPLWTTRTISYCGQTKEAPRDPSKPQ